MQPAKLHPLIPEAQEQLRKGKISRRDFLRFSTLLGLSLASAEVLAACQPAATPVPTAVPPTAVPPTAAPSATPKPAVIRGGKITAATRVEKVDHPARFSLVSQSHPWRHVVEYLTQIDEKGVVHPYLLESWQASDDLLTWTLKLRQGIKFNNGKDLTADDVLFNFAQWMNKDVGSSLLGSMSYLDPNGISKTDDYTVVCKLKSATIFLPEHLAGYAAGILPKDFGGDITREPVGTGAFTMAEYKPGERCHLVARKDYWRNGIDGKPLPYLDELVMVQLGEDRTPDVAALQTGQVDTILEPSVSQWEALKDDARFTVISTPTSATRVLRVRADQDPWKDNKVRQALKYCHNRDKILQVALLGQGTIGNDTHVAPAMADYAPLDPFPFDTAKAKALLAEAGHADGVTVELTVASDWPESMAYAQALKEDAAAGGFTINLKPMPASQYWAGWTDFNMGITWWSHRPLAPMVLDVAYVRDASGKPAPWNESHWTDDDFEKQLKQAEGTLDLEKRRAIIGQLEAIMKDHGPICTPFFMNVWKIYDKRIHGVDPSPEEFAIFYEAWREA